MRQFRGFLALFIAFWCLPIVIVHKLVRCLAGGFLALEEGLEWAESWCAKLVRWIAGTRIE